MGLELGLSVYRVLLAYGRAIKYTLAHRVHISPFITNEHIACPNGVRIQPSTSRFAKALIPQGWPMIMAQFPSPCGLCHTWKCPFVLTCRNGSFHPLQPFFVFFFLSPEIVSYYLMAHEQSKSNNCGANTVETCLSHLLTTKHPSFQPSFLYYHYNELHLLNSYNGHQILT